MTDTTIRIDVETARLVTELAHLMERTKKPVMADAVAGYAHARLPALADGRLRYGELSPRERLVLRRDELLRAFEQHGTTNVRVLDPLAPEGTANVAIADDGTGDGASHRCDDNDESALDGPAFGDLAFGDPSVGDTTLGSHREMLTLLAETDIILGGEAESMMEDLARQVLGMRVEVISMTKLSLFNPELLERLVRESAPL